MNTLLRHKGHRLSLAVVLALAAVIVTTFGQNNESPIPNTQAALLADDLDLILDALPKQQLEINQRTINEWTAEILPYFEYEGIIASAFVPNEVRLTSYVNAMENFHVLGRAYCSSAGGGPIEINARVGNPVSAWYGRTSFLATLVHELGHVQGGGLCSDNSDETESTTQLVTLEVLAAMANGGNKLALYAVLDELRDMLMGAVQYEAMVGKVDGWREFRERVYSTPEEIARSEKSARRWRSNRPLLKEILFKYSYVPVQKILKGLPDEKIPKLMLGEPPWDGWDGAVIPYVQPLKPRALAIDDLAYVLDHAEEILNAPRGPKH